MSTSQASGADTAWQVLDLVNGWIKHADTKAVAALGSAGVVGGALYALVHDQQSPATALVVASWICGLMVVTSGTLAACTLWSRLGVRSVPTSGLYFDHIARRHRRDANSFAIEFLALIGDPAELAHQIALQISVNSLLAHRKHRWSNRALLTALASVAALGMAAALTLMET